MALVMIIAIALLAVIFMTSFVVLLVICKHKCGKFDFTAQKRDTQYRSAKKTSPTNKQVELIGADYKTDILGNGQCFSTEDNLSDIFLDPDWQGDAESLVCHCVELLKTCHHLTEKLVAYTVENGLKMKSQEFVKAIVQAAKNISPKVDELVDAMYSPSDSRQIEEKSRELYLSVHLLLQVIKSVPNQTDELNWADDIIHTIEQHIEEMRKDSQSDPNLLGSAYSRNEPMIDGKQGLCFVNRTFLS